MTEIVGIALVRDEDRFVERSIRNALDFCDRILLCDHRSRDGTPAILERLAREEPDKLELHRLDDTSRSHDLIAPLAGRDIWASTGTSSTTPKGSAGSGHDFSPASSTTSGSSGRARFTRSSSTSVGESPAATWRRRKQAW